MKHEKIDAFPHGMTEIEAEILFSSEDVYDILETFDTLEDAFNFIKESYGISSYEYAKADAEQSINEEKSFIEYMHNKGEINYVGYTSFDISNSFENYQKSVRMETSFFWFSTGRVVRAELY